MKEYYFADYKLNMDDRLAEESAWYLSPFSGPTPYTHPFSVREGNAAEREEYFFRAEKADVLFKCDKFNVLRFPEGPAFYHEASGAIARALLVCSCDYGDMTAYVLRDQYVNSESGESRTRKFPFRSTLSHAIEAGTALRSGMAMHASLVEQEGRGILFLGPSGMGKSTQARLWERCLGADMLSGDRPCIRKTEVGWYAYGMPWDGKDRILRQCSVPLRAAVVLEQAEKNEIRRMTPAQAMAVLFRQVSIPVWDRHAADAVLESMAEAARHIPFWHLKNKADESCARMTYHAIFG